MATDLDQMPIDGIEDYDQYADQGDDDAVDQDFGALQMFDSNASSAPYSSQIAGGQAPEAVMDDVPSSAPSKKSKRDKKSKKKRKGSHLSSEEPTLPSLPEEPTVKSNGSERLHPLDAPPSAQPGSSDAVHEDALATPGEHVDNEETIIPSTQTKKKRKSSDSTETKRRKKRKTRDDEADVVQSTQQSVDTNDLQVAASQDEAAEADAAEDPASTNEANMQNSPSAARLGRSSHARQPRRKKTSKNAQQNEQADMEGVQDEQLPVESAQHEVESNNGADNSADTTAELLAAQLGNEPDMQGLVQAVWDERLSQGNTAESQQNGEDHDMGLPEQSQYPDAELGIYDVPDSPPRAEEPPSTSKRPRSTRAKKTKPIYNDDADDVEENVHALAELPSPTAMTPKPRKRRQPAARAAKSSQPERPTYVAQGASDEENDDEPRGRRNRMAGYTQGRFSEDELARIRRAVESFRVENDLDQHTVNEMIQAPGGTTAGDAHAQLWVRVFAECPDRHRQKVINITRKKFHNFVARGTWTTEQDAELTDLIRVHGTKWSKIAALINRHPEDVRDRYRNYIVCGDNQKKDAWDEEEEARLTQYVIEAMEMIDGMRHEQPDRELLQRPYEELIDWQEISEKMNRTRSRLQCITKWKSLNIKTNGKDKLISSDPGSNITFRVEKARRQIADMDDVQDRYRLVLAIKDTAAGKESKIPWQRLCDKAWRSKWHRYTQVLLWKRLKQTIPGWENKTVRDCAQALVDYYNQHGELPDVVSGTYDDAEEMAVVQAVASSSSQARPSASQSKNSRSAEFVTDSDAEDQQGAEMETHQNGGMAEEADMGNRDELKIDPALSAQTPSALKTSPAMRSPSREAALFRKTPKKGQHTVDDPIEEMHDGVDLPDEMKDDFVTGQGLHSAPDAIMDDARAPLAGELSDSVMDDMEDVPAEMPLSERMEEGV